MAAICAIGFAVAAIFAFAKQVDAELNSPEMIHARAIIARREALDALAKAQANNDIEAERRAAETVSE